MMRILLRYLAFLALGLAGARADAPLPPAGIIILKAVAGYPAGAVSFVAIQWVNTDGGYVTDSAGARTPFTNDAVGRIIYFDQAFYDEVDHNQYWLDWRAGMQNRELVLPPMDSIRLTQADLPRIQSEEHVLEDAIERYPSGSDLVSPIIASLKDDISHLSSGVVLQNGKWMTQQEADALVAVPTVGEVNRPVTFTTRDGKKYVNVRVRVTDTGLNVLTSDGGVSIPFDQMPDDLSAFSGSTRTQIQAWVSKDRVAGAAEQAAPAPVTAAPATGWVERIESFWHWVVSKVSSFFSSSFAATPTPSVATPAAALPPAVPLAAKEAPDLSKAVVLIKGDVAEGTGFLVRMADGPVVVTNLHVVSGNPNLKILTASGEQIVPLSMKGASDRDLALFAIQDNHYSYLPLASNVDQTAAVGDAAITPGDSEGGEVTLKTSGNLVGIGPQRVEISNPVFHGNSGGPVYDVKIGKVVAVVTGATTMNPQDELDKNSYANANSAIKGPMRYFGLRLDTVPSWVPYDQNQFVNEALFLKVFHQESCALDAYINGAKNVRGNIEDEPPNATFYATSAKIQAADEKWHRSNSADREESAKQELVWDLGTLANQDMGALQDPASFYPYDQPRAKYELAYRKALKTEIENMASQINKPAPNPGLDSGL